MTENNQLEPVVTPDNDRGADQNPPPDANAEKLPTSRSTPAGPKPRREPKGRSPELQIDAPTSTEQPRSAFDINRMRLNPSASHGIVLKKVLTGVQITKPHRQDFIRVRAGDAWRFPASVIESRIDRGTYLVDPDMRSVLVEHLVAKMLYLAMPRSGDVFFWPVKMQSGLGDLDSWSESAHEAAHLAQDQWVSIRSNQKSGRYDAIVALGDLPEPTWPEESLETLLAQAFKGRVIESIDHPVARQLRGLE
jgi:hypothetical protein